MNNVLDCVRVFYLSISDNRKCCEDARIPHCICIEADSERSTSKVKTFPMGKAILSNEIFSHGYPLLDVFFCEDGNVLNCIIYYDMYFDTLSADLSLKMIKKLWGKTSGTQYDKSRAAESSNSI